MWTTLCLFVLMTQLQSQDVGPDVEAESVRSSRDLDDGGRPSSHSRRQYDKVRGTDYFHWKCLLK